jgi:hypothetical protein
MARWLLAFRAIDPKRLDGHWEVGVSERHYRYLQNHGHEKQIARLVLVQEVLEGGTVNLYKGWSRPEKEECFVYEGRPTRDFKGGWLLLSSSCRMEKSMNGRGDC